MEAWTAILCTSCGGLEAWRLEPNNYNPFCVYRSVCPPLAGRAPQQAVPVTHERTSANHALARPARLRLLPLLFCIVTAMVKHCHELVSFQVAALAALQACSTQFLYGYTSMSHCRCSTCRSYGRVTVPMPLPGNALLLHLCPCKAMHDCCCTYAPSRQCIIAAPMPLQGNTLTLHPCPCKAMRYCC